MYLVFDIGGTKMRVATSENGTLGEIQKVPTPKNGAQGLDQLISTMRELAADKQLEGIAGGIPGVVQDGRLLWEPPHLTGWIGTNIAVGLQTAFSVPVSVRNDTAVVGLGEAHVGNGKGAPICVYITVSTGVGGVRIVDGEIDHAAYGFEIGHQLVHGIELEQQISGTAVRAKYGVEPKDLASLEERTKLADIFAEGLYNTILHWSPHRIVIGGSMIVGVNPIPLDRVQSTLASKLTMHPMPEIVMAALKDDGGLLGASILAQKVR